MRVRAPLLTGIGGLAVAAALFAGSALPAAADTSSPSPSPAASPSSSPSAGPTSGACRGSTAAVLACIKQRAATAIANRETTLQALTTALNNSANVTAGDKSTLLGQIQGDESGLSTLNTTIQNDTTVQQAWSDAQTIVTGYRVYVLEAPKVHLVIAADTETAVESFLQSVMPAVQTAITDSNASADKKAEAQAAFNDCASQLAAAQSETSGVVGSVINLEASGYPGNEPTLASARQSVTTARQDLGNCHKDLESIREDLGL
ncbi:MAG TPA: hypothetical protein VEK76_06605 [Candidatus Binatia bacterium]|nr:hypothetical protein [Candidatus Binatia bacterium]